MTATSEDSLNQEPSREVNALPTLEYVQLQQRIFRVILIVSAFSVAISAFFFGFETAGSIFVGACFGALYLRLLARNVGKIGDGTRTFGKIQLIVPVLLVLGVSRTPQLELLPALIGFLLYKPSLIFQFYLESFNSKKG